MQVICFGDSNTYGYDPRSYFADRYEPEARWVDVLASMAGWNLQNEGMNGRTIPIRRISFPENTDLLLIMLGTNDLLQGEAVDQILCKMDAFLHGLEMPKEKLLLVAPPPMQLGQWVADNSLVEKSRELAKEYRTLAQRAGIRFVDAGSWNIELCYDGVHFTENGHVAFANGLFEEMRNICPGGGMAP